MGAAKQPIWSSSEPRGYKRSNSKAVRSKRYLGAPWHTRRDEKRGNSLNNRIIAPQGRRGTGSGFLPRPGAGRLSHQGNSRNMREAGLSGIAGGPEVRLRR